MKYVTFRKLVASDSTVISDLLVIQPPSYLQYFQPFRFESSSIREILTKANKDIFLGIELCSGGSEGLIGFYMLRGLDEGYEYPMYGIFVSRRYTGKGIASLSLRHAECLCKLNGYKKLLLKVHPDNIIAKTLYESFGFQFFKDDSSNNNLILYKDF